MVTGVTPNRASLGQFVNLEGGGFVGVSEDDEGSEEGSPLTKLRLRGVFTSVDGKKEVRFDDADGVLIIPTFVSGNLVRYVLDEQDAVGKLIDLRKLSGKFEGTFLPIIQYGQDQYPSNPNDHEGTRGSFDVGYVTQIVHIRFLPGYITSLKHFGLRAADQLIRERVFEVAARDYLGASVAFRAEKPTDFAVFATVDLAGPDPNGTGLLGYDNSPGKDKYNQRLYDHIGGENALTQKDGYPGYGGVFTESFFGFSMHPNGLATRLQGADPFFDAIFDPFRPDVGGLPVSASDLATLDIPKLVDGSECPAQGDRGLQLACAVWVLGSMVGSTMTHEVGHSLGLADPYGGEFHNQGDEPERLMDSGGGRPFTERAEILGGKPGMFCDEDFAYLRKYLPSTDPDPVKKRPSCW